MATKTITVTVDAYESLKSLKEPRESFSETIERVAGKRSLMEFVGTLSEESAIKLENNIKRLRKEYTDSYNRKIKKITSELRGGNGSSR